MDIEDFFSGKSNTAKEENKKDASIAILNSFLADPLIYRIDEQFKIIRDNPIGSVNRLIEGVVSSALIETLDYAKGKGNWKVIPDICIAAKGSLKTINLFFNKDIRDLSKIAVDSNDPTAIALCKIVMQEKYEIAPEFIVINCNLTEQLKKADAVLLSGNEAFKIQQSNKLFIDLTDEWFDLTGLPFVYALWAVHEMDLNPSIVKQILSTVESNLKNLDQTLNFLLAENNKIDSAYTNLINHKVIYRMGLEEKEAITEFFRYAFFFGQIEHIPDLHFCL